MAEKLEHIPICNMKQMVLNLKNVSQITTPAIITPEKLVPFVPTHIPNEVQNVLWETTKKRIDVHPVGQ